MEKGLCQLIGREEVYDVDTISLDELYQQVKSGLQALEDSKIDLKEEEKSWRKKATKLIEVMELELQERKAVEQFGELLVSKQAEEKYFNTLNDFNFFKKQEANVNSNAIEQYRLQDPILENQINQSTNQIQDFQSFPSLEFQQQIKQQYELGNREEYNTDRDNTTDRVELNNRSCTSRGNLFFNTQAGGFKGKDLQEFMRKTLSQTLIKDSNSSNVNPFGKQNIIKKAKGTKFVIKEQGKKAENSVSQIERHTSYQKKLNETKRNLGQCKSVQVSLISSANDQKAMNKGDKITKTYQVSEHTHYKKKESIIITPIRESVIVSKESEKVHNLINGVKVEQKKVISVSDKENCEKQKQQIIDSNFSLNLNLQKEQQEQKQEINKDKSRSNYHSNEDSERCSIYQKNQISEDEDCNQIISNNQKITISKEQRQQKSDLSNQESTQDQFVSITKQQNNTNNNTNKAQIQVHQNSQQIVVKYDSNNNNHKIISKQDQASHFSEESDEEINKQINDDYVDDNNQNSNYNSNNNNNNKNNINNIHDYNNKDYKNIQYLNQQSKESSKQYESENISHQYQVQQQFWQNQDINKKSELRAYQSEFQQENEDQHLQNKKDDFINQKYYIPQQEIHKNQNSSNISQRNSESTHISYRNQSFQSFNSQFRDKEQRQTSRFKSDEIPQSLNQSSLIKSNPGTATDSIHLLEQESNSKTSFITTVQSPLRFPNCTIKERNNNDQSSHQMKQQMIQSESNNSSQISDIHHYSSASASASVISYSNKVRLPSLPMQYQIQLQQSLAYMQNRPLQPELEQKSNKLIENHNMTQSQLDNISYGANKSKIRTSRSQMLNPHSKQLEKIMLAVGRDEDLIDYSEQFMNFNQLFSSYYLSSDCNSNSKNISTLESMIEIYQIFADHLTKVDSNPEAAHSSQISRMAINLVDGSPAEQSSSTEIMALSNKININLQTYFNRQSQQQLTLEEKQLNNEDNQQANARNAYQQPYYRVVKNKTEVFQIISKSFLRRPNWTELPHAINLKTSWNLLWTWAKPQIDFKKLFFFQKVNHFLQNKNISRKDLLLKNLRLAMKHGPKAANEFDIMPMTFLLPKESVAFSNYFYQQQFQIEQEEGSKTSSNIWIIKPTSSSRGKGIFLINDINKIQYSEQVIAQKYLQNPLLIRGHKFDMRIYVLVTSFNPLEAFLYKEGFARLSTIPFSLEEEDIENRMIHLTNYAVQKESLDQGAQSIGGTKMSLKMLRKQLDSYGVKWAYIWKQVEEVILKSLIACQVQIPNNPNSFELFGYDIIIDKHKKCWLLEVNASPSLATDHLLDDIIKQQLVDDIVDLVDPIKYDRNRLVEVLGRRIKEEQGHKSTLNTYNNSSLQLNRDLNYILHKQATRNIGVELPKKLGEFQKIAPTETSKRIEQLINSHKKSASQSKSMQQLPSKLSNQYHNK